MISEFSIIITTRYNLLKNTLTKIFEDCGDDGQSFVREIKQMSKMYKNLYETVEGVNAFFGNVLLAFLMNMQITILASYYWLMFEWNSSLNQAFFIASLSTMTCYLVSVHRNLTAFY